MLFMQGKEFGPALCQYEFTWIICGGSRGDFKCLLLKWEGGVANFPSGS